jgi:hypothetical protein
MGKSTISTAIFNSYVNPEGISKIFEPSPVLLLSQISLAHKYSLPFALLSVWLEHTVPPEQPVLPFFLILPEDYW